MSARAMHDINVIGSLQLLAACEKARHAARDRHPRLGGHLRLRARRRRSSSPRRWRGSTRCALASSATSARSRTTSRPSRRRHPRSPARCCATSRRSGPSLDTQITRYLALPRRADLPRLRPAAPVRARARRDRGARRGGQEPGARRRSNVAAPGTIGLTRMIRWPARRQPAAAAAGLRRRPCAACAASGCRDVARLPAPAALRARRRHHPPDRRGRLPAALHDGGGDRATTSRAARPPARADAARPGGAR